jgi:hypothetical protein
MTPDLPPDVRAKAGRKLRERSGYTVPAWKDLDPYEQESWASRADAVTSVVAPALKAENERLKAITEASDKDALAAQLEVKRLKAENEAARETIAILSDPDTMEAIREGENGISDEYRSGPIGCEHLVPCGCKTRCYHREHPEQLRQRECRMASDVPAAPVSGELADARATIARLQQERDAVGLSHDDTK